MNARLPTVISLLFTSYTGGKVRTLPHLVVLVVRG
jgi:hypothetical protein